MLELLSSQAVRFPIAPTSSLVVNDLYFPLSSAPAAFWAAVRSDGGDIRVYTQDGTTQCASEVSGFDFANKTGSLFFAVNGGTAFYVCAGIGAAGPAVDAATGKYAVWESAAKLVMHAGDLTDSTANQNNGTSTTPPSFVAGKLGNAASFTGQNEYINAGHGASLDITAQVTMMAWIKPYDTQPASLNPTVIDKWDWPRENRAMSLGFEGSRAAAFVSRDGIYTNRLGCQAATYPTVDEWMHLVATYDGKTLILYKNGQPISTATYATDYAIHSASTVDVVIGRARGTEAGRTLNAAVDEPRIYSRAFSAAEIAQLYANQNDPAAFWTVGAAI